MDLRAPDSRKNRFAIIDPFGAFIIYQPRVTAPVREVLQYG